jgi:hypothetical protein
MHKKFLALVAGLALLLGGLVAIQPAQAKQEAPAAVTATVAPYAIYSSYKMTPHWYPDVPTICVAVGDLNIPISASAQAWNNASVGFGLQASGNCVTAGYEAWRRMTIDTFNDPNWGSCFKITNAFVTGTYGTYQTMRYHTQNPVGLVNTAYNCTSTATGRAHWTSMVIGIIMGLKRLDGASWAGRVMCYCAQFGYPSASTDGDAISKLYQHYYVGIY